MAIPKSERKVRDIMKAEEMWKSLIRTEDDSQKTWTRNWDWIVQEYRTLEKNLKEKTEQSQFLTQVMIATEEDKRKIEKFPNSTNHEYGWLAENPEFALDRFGSDAFKAAPLPDVYLIQK